MMFSLLLVVSIGTSFAADKNDGCIPGSADCDFGTGSSSLTCIQYLLPWLCRIGHACCPKKDTIRASSDTYVEKRICLSTSKKCRKAGGTCENDSGDDGTCKTVTVAHLCNSPSCTCCIGDNTACGQSPKCRFRGGYCFKGKKKTMCSTRNTFKSGCSGKKCSCCITDRGCKCGQAITSERIIGGQEVKPPHKYPWIVGIQAPKELNWTYVCGGSIINEDYILTAAHCMFGLFGKPRGPKDLKVGIADHDQFSVTDNIAGVTALVQVTQIIIHENYKTARKGDDIALLKLKVPLNLESYPQLKPVCLPTRKLSYENAIGIVYGWGITESSNITVGVLRETSVPIWNPSCENMEIAGSKILPTMLCAAYKRGGKDTCAGDSGGPLTVEDKGIHTLVGITSFGVGCGLKDSPGVYTRVTSYLDWIMKNTQDSSYCN